VLIGVLPLSNVAVAEQRLIQREDVQNYIREISRAHGLQQNRLAGLFADVTLQQSVFLLLSDEEGFDAATAKGSYAAAMGMPQFISSSYRAYAVDFDGDGKRDLWNSVEDVIGSVANYFAQHGWRQGEAIAERVYPESAAWRSLVTDGLKPDLSASQLRGAGIGPRLVSSGKHSLYTLEQSRVTEAWVGHHNFYVITRYNHSRL